MGKSKGAGKGAGRKGGAKSGGKSGSKKGGKGGGGGGAGGAGGAGGGARAAASLSPSALANAAEWLAGPTYELGVAVARGAFTADECALVRETHSFPGSEEISDRDEDLGFIHQVWRIEKSRAAWAATYDKALALVAAVDQVFWRQLDKAKHVHPEVEYILYEVKKGAPLPMIEPHVDNASLITMVMMTMPSEEYAGGTNCFEGKEGEPHRRAKLEVGDAVFFRGELCEHWIEPVTAGRRSILQIEMCKMKAGRH